MGVNHCWYTDVIAWSLKVIRRFSIHLESLESRRKCKRLAHVRHLPFHLAKTFESLERCLKTLVNLFTFSPLYKSRNPDVNTPSLVKTSILFFFLNVENVVIISEFYFKQFVTFNIFKQLLSIMINYWF